MAFRLRRQRSSDGLMPDASSASRPDRTGAKARPQLRQAPTKRSASGCLSRPPIRGGQNEPVSARIAEVDANGHQPAVPLVRAGDVRNAARRTRKGLAEQGARDQHRPPLRLGFFEVDNGHCKLILRPRHGHKRAGTGCEGLAALGTKGPRSDVESLFAIDETAGKSMPSVQP